MYYYYVEIGVTVLKYFTKYVRFNQPSSRHHLLREKTYF
jgi:hypothetical protein